MLEFDWQFWARHLPGLNPSEGLVVREVAFLADWRGVALASNEYLTRSTGLSLSSVTRAKKGLETKEVLKVIPRYFPSGRQGISRFELALKAMQESRPIQSTIPLPGLEADLPEPDPKNRLGQLIYQAAKSGWDKEYSGQLAAYLEKNLNRLLKTVRQNLILGMSVREAKIETLGWAWQAIRFNTHAILQAYNSWALLAVIVSRMAREASAKQEIALETLQLEGKKPLGSINQKVSLPGADLDTLETLYGLLIRDLVKYGVEETLAWACTLRLADLAVCGDDMSRRHTLAARDPKLSALGLSSKGARKWMTLVSGSRQNPEPFSSLSGEKYEKLLNEVIGGIKI